jgi:N,N-dimethylformamidase
MRLLAYVDRWSIQPGEELAVMVSAPAGSCHGELVRIVHGGPRAAGVTDAFLYSRESEPHSAPVLPQAILPGSYVEFDSCPALPPVFTICGWIWPTLVDCGHRQGIWSHVSGEAFLGLSLDVEGCLEMAWKGYGAPGRFRLEGRLLQREWYFVATSVDQKSGAISLHTWCSADWMLEDRTTFGTGMASFATTANGAMFLACRGTKLADDDSGRRGPQDVFNGKLDGFRLLDGLHPQAAIEKLRTGGAAEHCLSQCLAHWDFSREMHGYRAIDISGNSHHGVIHQAPMRAVTSHNWTGAVMDPALSPEQYGAIHFHDDDIDDMGWERTFRFEVSPEARSGLYAVRLFSGEAETFVPFFVRPRSGTATADLVAVLPTFTYLAYSNYVVGFDDIAFYTGEARDRDPADAYLRQHPELGLSTYNRHRDGSGIHHASRLRPMLNLDPRHRFWISGGGWTVGGDLYLLDWLAHEGIAYDILTDDDLHAEGAKALAGYKVVITGAHPEYSSGAILDSYRDYAQAGGHIMYLGGNGFYWVATPMHGRPHILEVRRGYAGTRAWNSQPGELHHASTGEHGGLWRHRGRPPQRIFGVGFAAQGGGDAAGFRRTPASESEGTAFLFEGVSGVELFGAYGNNLGGASGCEMDRADIALGTPRHARIVATSSGLHSDFYQNALEENAVMTAGRGGTQCAEVRADVVFFETNKGGAVFSVGSIDWTSALSENGFDNDVARITRNVLRAFAG